MADNYFKELYDINVNDRVEKKNGLSYLSWAWAWAEVKKRHPDSTYTIYENDKGWNYFTDGNTCWVKTGVTINGIEHIEYLPVMDHRNKSIPLSAVTSFDINKTIQRSLTKASARHGIGLYLYAGDDLPEDESRIICESCGKLIVEKHNVSVSKIVEGSMKAYGKKLCFDCCSIEKAKKSKGETTSQEESK